MNSDVNRHVKLTGLMTSFNRVDATLACLENFAAATAKAGITAEVILVDDASTDDTVASVLGQHPWVTVLRGGGNLYWNRGMHQAQAHAMTHDCDYLLWLNDDTVLQPDAIGNLLATAHTLKEKLGHEPIVVGSTADRVTGLISYGGHIAPQRWRPFTYQRAWHPTEPLECHAMNGNVVLIPNAIAHSVGNLDPVFEHAMGDTDYALRARSKGFQIFVAPGFVGHCSNNPATGTYRDVSQSFAVRWKQMMSRKGLPPRSWLHFTRRHGGLAWPVYFVWPYAKLVAISILDAMTRALRRQQV